MAVTWKTIVFAVIVCVAMAAGAWAQEDEDAVPAGSGPIEKNLVFATVDGKPLQYDIARPQEGTGPFPLILCIHAGAWQLGDKKSFRRDLRKLGPRGYVAVTVNYRLAPAYRWPAQLEDVRTALRYFRSHAAEFNIDPARVAAVGDDSGGHLALMLALLGAKEEKDVPVEKSTRVQAVVNLFGPTDLREWRVTSAWVETKVRIAFFKSSEQVLQDFVGTLDRTAPIFAEVSPVSHVTPDAPPIMTIVGSEDPLITLDQPRAFHEALRKAGVKEELVIIEGADHDFYSIDKNGEATKKMFGFFDKCLKGAEGAK